MEHCKKCQELNRRAQAAESQVIKLQRQIKALTETPARRSDTWASPKRKAEAVERDRMAKVIELTELRRY